MENLSEKNNIWEYIKTGLFYLAAFVLVFYIVVSLFFPAATVKIFGFKPYVVITDSMEPNIMVRDLIIVGKPKVDELEVEDIITFYADINYDGEKEIVTHYIYSISENVEGELIFRTHRHYEEGATVNPDNWVLNEDDVLGRHMVTIPKLGYVVQFVKSPFGIAAIFVNIGIIGGIVYLVKNEKKDIEVKEDKEETK